MIFKLSLPLFLWKYAIQHATYIQNHLFTSALKEKTPYKAWTKEHPDISNFGEFGSPVWIKFQGAHKGSKLDRVSGKHYFVGFRTGCKGIKYYNPDTRKILTSQNFKFLSVMNYAPSSPDGIEIEIKPHLLHKGEYKGAEGGTPQSSSDMGMKCKPEGKQEGPNL